MTDYPEPKGFADIIRGLMGERGIKSAKLLARDLMLQKYFRGDGNPFTDPAIEGYLRRENLKYGLKKGFGNGVPQGFSPVSLADRRDLLSPGGTADAADETEQANNPTEDKQACATCSRKRLVILINRQKAVISKLEDGWHWHGIIGRMTAGLINEGERLPRKPFENPLLDTLVYETKGPPTKNENTCRALLYGDYQIKAMEGDHYDKDGNFVRGKHSTYDYNRTAGKEKLRAMNIVSRRPGIDIHVSLNAMYSSACVLAVAPWKTGEAAMQFDGRGWLRSMPRWAGQPSLDQVTALVELVERYKKFDDNRRNGDYNGLTAEQCSEEFRKIKSGEKLDVGKPVNGVTVRLLDPDGGLFRDVIVMEDAEKMNPQNQKKNLKKKASVWTHRQDGKIQVKIRSEKEFEIISDGVSQILAADDRDHPKGNRDTW